MLDGKANAAPRPNLPPFEAPGRFPEGDHRRGGDYFPRWSVSWVSSALGTDSLALCESSR